MPYLYRPMRSVSDVNYQAEEEIPDVQSMRGRSATRERSLVPSSVTAASLSPVPMTVTEECHGPRLPPPHR